MAGSMVYRLEAGPPDDAAVLRLAKAMRSLQARLDNKSFNYIAGMHGAPGWYCWHHQASRRTPVQARLFLPWHRAYLWYLEQALRDASNDAALVWWDWTTTRRIPQSFAAAKIDQEDNPLRRYRIRLPATAQNPAVNRNTVRSPGSVPGTVLPTAAEVQDLLDDSDWPSFSDRLESLHDDVHVWVSGDMGNVTYAGFDPVFWAHHCMIDRIWYLWQVKWGINQIQPELLNLPLQPFGKTVRQTLDTQALGYEYAVSTAGTSNGGGA